MGINYSKKSKVSFLLSTMILGSVSLSAVQTDIKITKPNTSGIDLGKNLSSNKVNTINISSNINLVPG